MALFLRIDTKRASSDTQLGKPLKKYIEEQGSYKIGDFQEAINEVEKLRENIRIATDKKDILAMYFRYYAVLCSLDRRVPINEQEVRINFNWYDLYKQKKIGRYSVRYEMACVLFNIGAIHSELACNENLEAADGIKNACKYFKMAAGAFDQLKQFLEGHPEDAASEDLSADSLVLLTSLMLAQAQELYYMMALKTNMKPGAVTKLAAQASDYYATAGELMLGATLKPLVPKRWSPFVELKRDCMKAVAHFQLGRHCKEAKLYGEELARYRVAQKYLSAASKFKPVVPELTPWFDQIVSTVMTALNLAEKDNSTIYHESVPTEHKLPALEKKVMVGPEKLPDDKLKLQPNADPFGKLIPFRVRKADSIYSERKADLLRNLSTEVEKQNGIAKKTLHEMGLPGALEALETPHGIPLSLLKKMEHVRNEGASAKLNEQLELLHNMAAEDTAILDSAVLLLDEEEKDDTQLRGQYGNAWVRTPSHALTANLRQEAQKHKADLEHAIKSDAYIKTKLIENQMAIDLLAQDEGKILSLLPEAARQDVSVVALKQLLKQLDELIFQCETALAQLKDRLAKEDILEQLIKSQESEQETVFTQALGQYDGLVASIKKYSDCNDLLAKIQEENQKFNQKKSSNAQLLQRQQVLQDFELAYTNFLQLKCHLSEGVQFYTNFQEILQKFKGKCSDFVYARKTEKHDIITDIQARATGMAMSTSMAQPFGFQGTPQPATSSIAIGQIGSTPLNGRGPMLVTPQQLNMQQPQVRVLQPTQNQPVVFWPHPQHQQFQPQPQQFQQQPQPQPQFQQQPHQFQQPASYQQHQHQQQAQPPPPSYTQSQAQRSVFPVDPYGSGANNFPPNTGY